MDRAEFDELHAAWAQRLTGQLYAMLGDRRLAEDCVRAAFARAWARGRRLDAGEHPEAWVRATAYRLATARWRGARHGGGSAVAPPDGGADGRAGDADGEHLALLVALGRLPAAQRRALVLHHVAGLPVAAVARETGVPEAAARSRLARGEDALGVPVRVLRRFPAERFPLRSDSPASLRRRGERLRARRGAALLAGAVLVAGAGLGVAVAGDAGDRAPGRGDPSRAATRSVAPRPTGTAPPADPLARFFAAEPPASELVGRGDVPRIRLAEGLPDLTAAGGALTGPSPDLPGVDRRLVCGRPVLDQSRLPTGRLVAASTGQAYLQVRQVVGFASAAVASAQLAYLRGVVGGCGTQLGEVTELGWTRVEWRVFQADAGPDTFTFGAVVEPTRGGQLYQVTRVARWLVVVSLGGEYLPDSQVEAVPEVTAVSRTLADQLCGSTAAGC